MRINFDELFIAFFCGHHLYFHKMCFSEILHFIDDFSHKNLPAFHFCKFLILIVIRLPHYRFFKSFDVFLRCGLFAETDARSETIGRYGECFGNILSINIIEKTEQSAFQKIKMTADFPFFQDKPVFIKCLFGKGCTDYFPVIIADGSIFFYECFDVMHCGWFIWAKIVVFRITSYLNFEHLNNYQANLLYINPIAVIKYMVLNSLVRICMSQVIIVKLITSILNIL